MLLSFVNTTLFALFGVVAAPRVLSPLQSVKEILTRRVIFTRKTGYAGGCMRVRVCVWGGGDLTFLVKLP